MKKTRYSDSQFLAILRQAEGGVPVSELCREHDMSNASFYKWRAKIRRHGCVDNQPDEGLSGLTAMSARIWGSAASRPPRN